MTAETTFRIGDKIIYNNGGNADISTLAHGTRYYITHISNSNKTIKLKNITTGIDIDISGTLNGETQSFKIDTNMDTELTLENISSTNDASKVRLDNRTFTSASSKNPIISTRLKNIVSIKLQRVIIPKPRDEVFKPDPYYLVCIDEFGSNIITTKHFNEKIFSKVHFDKELVFGGVGNSSVTAGGEGISTDAAQSVLNNTYDDGRKYLYYKNDDGDQTNFYSAPLASLENLTIKILDSRGRLLDVNFNDSDRGTYDDTKTPKITGKFLNNSFSKDNIINLSEDKEGVISEISGVVYTNNNMNLPTGGNIRVYYDDKSATNVRPNDTDEIVNLTNQIEYIFEVVTKEPDIEKDYIADLI